MPTYPHDQDEFRDAAADLYATAENDEQRAFVLELLADLDELGAGDVQ